MYRSTMKPADRPPRTRLVWRKAEVVTAITVSLLTGGLALTMAQMWTDPSPLDDTDTHTVVVNEDGGHVPRCTDAIADAGGVCHGEPLPPCPTEDSHDCYWDATTMGNGKGRSFIDVGGVQILDDER